MSFLIKNRFSQELPADPNKSNSRRQVFESCFSFVSPRRPKSPKLIHVSGEMANELGLTKSFIESKGFLDIFSGFKEIEGSAPYAMCYGGHQFGHWAGQLGDGRAINLAEIESKNNIWALQLKGSGETPYSRSADGLAVLRSSIREHLCSEAMHHLGIPTTRSLSLILTGDQVLRDIMYDGNADYEKGAVVCRAATSFIRFGNFQIFASRGDTKNLQKLADYTIKHHYPKINISGSDKYIVFFEAVAERTLKMILDWQRVGFVHGVMNTDNMSILGLTIDYGPYGWLENYDSKWTPNTTDRQHKRYAFGNQPAIAHWNLYQLANTLNMLVDDPKPFESILKNYKNQFIEAHEDMQLSKLGLKDKMDGDNELYNDLYKLFNLVETDMTIFYRLLANASKETDPPTLLEIIHPAFYNTSQLIDDNKDQWLQWLNQYILRLKKDSKIDGERKRQMNLINPKYVLRNYMAQMAIDLAEKEDYTLIDELYQLLKKPYDEQPSMEKWFAKRPEWANHKIGCSMLSCSS